MPWKPDKTWLSRLSGTSRLLIAWARIVGLIGVLAHVLVVRFVRGQIVTIPIRSGCGSVPHGCPRTISATCCPSFLRQSADKRPRIEGGTSFPGCDCAEVRSKLSDLGLKLQKTPNGNGSAKSPKPVLSGLIGRTIYSHHRGKGSGMSDHVRRFLWLCLQIAHGLWASISQSAQRYGLGLIGQGFVSGQVFRI